MKVFLCAQRSFGRAVLKELLDRGHDIVGVAPPPQEQYYDKIVGLAMLNGVPVISDCAKLTSAAIPEDTDLIVAAHSHWYISEKVIAKARTGGIGFHPSLLPLHRGRDAVRWAVQMGDRVTGLSVYWLNDKVDGGDIQAQRVHFIRPGIDYHRLWEEMFPIGVDLLCDAVDDIGHGKIIREKQDESVATWEPSFDQARRLFRPELMQLDGAL